MPYTVIYIGVQGGGSKRYKRGGAGGKPYNEE